MDRLFVRKDVYEELIEKGFGKRDLSKLTKKKVTDKNGHTRTVYVRNGEQPAEVKQPNAQEGLTPEKKARYEEMLEKVKAGSDENALFVRGKGMLNKKDAIAHLEGKLGKNQIKNDYDNLMAKKEKEYSDKVKKQGYDYQDLRETGKLPDNLNAKALREIRDKARADGNQTDKTIELYQAAQERLDEISREKAQKKNVAQKMADAEDKAYDDFEKDSQKKYGNMSIEELKAEAKKYDGVSKYSPEANEARKVYDILNQKLEDEKKNSKTKTEPKSKKFSYDDAVNAIKEGKTVQWKSRDGSWNDVDPKSSELVMARDIGSELRIKPSQDDMKENYLDAKNEGGKDIADENRIDTHSKNAINLNDSEVKKMQKMFDYIPENANGNQIMNTIYDEDKGLYKKLSEMDIEYKKLHPEAEGKTFGFDLATKYLEDSFNEYKKDHEVGKDKVAEMSVEDIRKEQQNLLDDYNKYYNSYKNGKNDGSKLREYFKKFDVYKTALDKKSKK